MGANAIGFGAQASPERCEACPSYSFPLRTALTVTVLVLLGCATGSALRPLDPSHPASPSAAEAPTPESTILQESPTDEGGPASHAGHARHGDSPNRGGANWRTSVEYTCPMHHEVRQWSPGQCPKCGMTLVRAGAAGAENEGRQ